jgi:hypothetical protein
MHLDFVENVINVDVPKVKLDLSINNEASVCLSLASFDSVAMITRQWNRCLFAGAAVAPTAGAADRADVGRTRARHAWHRRPVLHRGAFAGAWR